MSGNLYKNKGRLDMEYLVEDVPLIKQFQVMHGDAAQSQSCWIVNSVMAMNSLDPLHPIDPNVLLRKYNIVRCDLLESGKITEKAAPEGKTAHGILVLVIHNEGFRACCEEFRSVNIDPNTGEMTSPGAYTEGLRQDAVKEFRDAVLDGRRPIVSMDKDFTGTKDSHAILLTGVETDESGEVVRFFYHNSDDRRGEGAYEKVYIDRFLKHWLGLAMFIGPKVSVR